MATIVSTTTMMMMTVEQIAFAAVWLEFLSPCRDECFFFHNRILDLVLNDFFFRCLQGRSRTTTVQSNRLLCSSQLQKNRQRRPKKNCAAKRLQFRMKRCKKGTWECKLGPSTFAHVLCKQGSAPGEIAQNGFFSHKSILPSPLMICAVFCSSSSYKEDSKIQGQIDSWPFNNDSFERLFFRFLPTIALLSNSLGMGFLWLWWGISPVKVRLFIFKKTRFEIKPDKNFGRPL